MRRLCALLAFGLLGSMATAEDVRIGVLGLDPDPRFDERMAYAGIETARRGPPDTAARLAVADMAMLMSAVDLEPVLDIRLAHDTDRLLADAADLAAQGVRYLILDLPAAQVDTLARALGPDGPLLLNATAPEDSLRRACHPRMLHTAASDRMTSDALVQHMLAYGWERILVLQGKTDRDRARAASFVASAERMRLRVVEIRDFDLSTNPAMRDENNTRLLTGSTRDYDAVFIADDFGEYARYLVYRTALPRPVVGATGLMPVEWHWSSERYGAPQVNSRFETAAQDGRRMGWQDWSVWIATRAVLTAEARARDRDPAAIEAFLRSDRFNLDGSKGRQMSFRPWSAQLRQPILLASANAIIAIAPLEGFEHRTNTLDSLGMDEAEFACD